MLINETCKACQIKRNLNAYPAGASPEEIRVYQSRVRDIIDHSDGLSTPQVAEQLYDLKSELFGAKDYTEIKTFFNNLMLSLLPHVERRLRVQDRVREADGRGALGWRAVLLGVPAPFVGLGAG